MNVTLTNEVWQRMRAYVDLCPDEISGLGKVERDDAGNFRIVDIALFDQVVSAAHSDISAESLAKFQVELIRKGESLEDWNFWWHSHAKMSVFFSGTDTSTIDSSTDFKYLVSLVTNHAHEFIARVDIYDPVRMYKDLQVEIEDTEDEAVLEACKAEIAAKVTRPVHRTYPHTGFARPYQGTVGFGHGQEDYLPISRTIDVEPQINSIDELEAALERFGTDDFAVAIGVWEQMMQDAETEVDYYIARGKKKEAKRARKELAKLKEIGKDYSLDIAYDS